MKLIRLLSYDMRQGFRQSGRRLAGIACLVLLSCLDLYLQKWNYKQGMGGDILRGSWMDYLLFLLGGRKRFDPADDLIFLLPIRWLLFHLYLLYAVLPYPCRDLQYSVGEHLMLRGGSRRRWWAAKCIWNMTFLCAAYLTVFAVVICFCAVTGERAGMQVTPELVITLFDTGTPYTEFAPVTALYVCLLPCLISMAAGQLLMLLSFLIKPVVSYLLLAVIFVSSAYLPSTFLIGNYAIPYRSAAVIPDGFLFWRGVTAGILIIVVCVAAGMCYFKKCDLIRWPKA